MVNLIGCVWIRYILLYFVKFLRANCTNWIFFSPNFEMENLCVIKYDMKGILCIKTMKMSLSFFLLLGINLWAHPHTDTSQPTRRQTKCAGQTRQWSRNTMNPPIRTDVTIKFNWYFSLLKTIKMWQLWYYIFLVLYAADIGNRCSLRICLRSY